MNLIPTWPIAAGTLVIGMAVGAGADNLVMTPKVAAAQKRYDTLVLANAEQERKRALAYAEESEAARKNQMAWENRVGEVEQEKTDEIARIRAAGAAELARVQNRPDRKPPAKSGVPEATPACQGATGAELSRPDAGFLVGVAARAEELKAALAACYSAYDAVR